MTRLVLIALFPLGLAIPAAAQTMDHGSMPGMTMPMSAKPVAKAKPPTAKTAIKSKPAPRRHRPAAQAASVTPKAASTASDVHAGHDMTGMAGTATSAAPSAKAPMADMPGMTGAQTPDGADMTGMKGMDMSAPNKPGAETANMRGMAEPEIPATPPPPPPTDFAAERFFDPVAMAAARATLRAEHGGAQVSKVMANLAEYQAGTGGGGYRWEGQAWVGGDIDRFVLKTEGEGTRRDGLDSAEVQGVYSRAIGPYFDLQAGVRQDFKPHARTYATVGFEGLAPYWFDVEGALFLSSKGELLARLEGIYDLRLTQRLILQPRAELNLAAQDTMETRTGSGVSNAELGLRLRYEVTRQFAPYIGVSYDRKFGKTGDYARALGEDVEATRLVVGLRAWF